MYANYLIETQLNLRPIHLITGSYTNLMSPPINVITGDDVSPGSEMLRTKVLKVTPAHIIVL